jgi:hypothetical protein
MKASTVFSNAPAPDTSAALRRVRVDDLLQFPVLPGQVVPQALDGIEDLARGHVALGGYRLVDRGLAVGGGARASASRWADCMSVLPVSPRAMGEIVAAARKIASSKWQKSPFN